MNASESRQRSEIDAKSAEKMREEHRKTGKVPKSMPNLLRKCEKCIEKQAEIRNRCKVHGEKARNASKSKLRSEIDVKSMEKRSRNASESKRKSEIDDYIVRKV